MPQSNLTLILGGARSGKSTYAETFAAQQGPRVIYLATAEPGDEDMRQRIANHRAQRPPTWQTLEIPRHIGQALTAHKTRPDAILVDCLTLLVSNILLQYMDDSQTTIETEINHELDQLLTAHQNYATPPPLIIVTNEVGLGIVPPTELGRTYRDLLGRANQRLAEQAKQVIFMLAGLPMEMKLLRSHL